MPHIIEETKEEEMATNLRVRFHERQQKRLNKAIEVGPSSNRQKTGDKGSSSKLVATLSLMSIHLSPLAPKA